MTYASISLLFCHFKSPVWGYLAILWSTRYYFVSFQNPPRPLRMLVFYDVVCQNARCYHDSDYVVMHWDWLKSSPCVIDKKKGDRWILAAHFRKRGLNCLVKGEDLIAADRSILSIMFVSNESYYYSGTWYIYIRLL